MVEYDNINEDFLLKFPKYLRNVIRRLWIEGVGISSKCVEIILSLEDNLFVSEYYTQFILKIPYAGRKLLWQVFFKDEDLDFPPDFEFQDTFLGDPDVDIISKNIPSLLNWDAKNENCLVSVIKEFLKLHKSYQIDVLSTDNKYSKILEEYRRVIEEIDILEDNIEVLVDFNTDVHFHFSMAVDFSNLPPYIQPVLQKNYEVLNPSKSVAILQVSYLKTDCSRVQCSLILSPLLEQVLGNHTNMHIPMYNKENTLANYIRQVQTLLKEKVEEVVLHYNLRNEYISCLTALCGCNIIEYDSTLFTKATLLCEIDNFYIIASISFGDKFPQEKPEISLYSVYHTKVDKPLKQVLKNYPYSPKWKIDEMVVKLMLFLNEEIPKFCTACTESIV